MSDPVSGLRPFVLVTRGSIVESVHFGAAAVVDVHGKVLAHAGDVGRIVATRSCVKTFQALELMERVGPGIYEDSSPAIALLCASHSGEPKHAQTAAWMLSKIGLGEGDLRCGVHALTSPVAIDALAGASPTQLHNNCSGKHAGMLALAQHLGASLDDYTEVDHPVQIAAWKNVAAMAGMDPERVLRARDGCSAVTFGLPMRALAQAAARLADPEGGALSDVRAAACERLMRAIREAPEHAGGSRHLDTSLMRATGGRLYSKVGAEALHLVAVPRARSPWSTGVGIVVKLVDGLAERARAAVMIDVLCKLGLLSAAERDGLGEAGLDDRVIRNHRGLEVGAIRVVAELDGAPGEC
ncbi:MAG: asparaginase [Deltaproteobacteria bacterium]|nr:asparaginase [Deltaproteobacteria bacterium]